MKQRLQILLSKENLSPVRFAEIVGVQRSSVSHILSGRNNPSLDFIQKILQAFPKVSSDWLISGKGEIYRSSQQAADASVDETFNAGPTAGHSGASDLFSAVAQQESRISEAENPDMHKVAEAINAHEEAEIEHIVIFYKDKSFRSYHPKGD